METQPLDASSPMQNMPPAPPMQPVQPMPPQGFTPPPQKSRSWMPLIVVIIIVLVAGGAAVWAYTTFFSTTRPDPRTELVMAMAKATTATSINYAGTFGVQGVVPGANGGTFAVTGTTTGMVDDTSHANPKLDVNIVLGVAANQSMNGTPYSINASLDEETRVIDQDLYFKLNDLSITGNNPALVFVSGFVGGIVAEIKGKWLMASSTSLDASYKANNNMASEQQALADRLKSLDYLDSITELPDASVKGIPTYHYEIVVNTQKLLKEIESVASTTIAANTITSNPMVAAAVSSLQQSNPAMAMATDSDPLDNLNLPETKVDVWIGKSDTYVHQYQIPPQTFTITGNTATVDGVMTLDGYNTPVDIQVPPGAMSIQQLVSSMMPAGMMGTTPTIPTTTKTTVKTTVKKAK